jgi:hypothetical protein
MTARARGGKIYAKLYLYGAEAQAGSFGIRYDTGKVEFAAFEPAVPVFGTLTQSDTAVGYHAFTWIANDGSTTNGPIDARTEKQLIAEYEFNITGMTDSNAASVFSKLDYGETALAAVSEDIFDAEIYSNGEYQGFVYDEGAEDLFRRIDIPLWRVVNIYTVTASAGTGGSITPSGAVEAESGADVGFTVSANSGYRISDVMVDGIGVGAVTSYAFDNVSSDHIIRAEFESTGGGTSGGGGGGGGGGGAGASPEPSETPEPEPADVGAEHLAYINGYPDGSFLPDGAITRAEAVVMLSRLMTAASADTTALPAFSDVEIGEWYAEAVEYMRGFDIITGYPDGSFRPNAAITRAEFAAVAVRFGGADAFGVGANFPDIPDDHWAVGSIAAAASRGWVTGYPDGSFLPDSPITRAEAVTIINRISERVCDREFVDTSDEITSFTDLTAEHWAYYGIMEAANSHEYARDTSGAERWLALLD